jgi:hypothetical protein
MSKFNYLPDERNENETEKLSITKEFQVRSRISITSVNRYAYITLLSYYCQSYNQGIITRLAERL